MSKSEKIKHKEENTQSEVEQTTLTKYRILLQDLSKRFSHIRALLVKYPKLAEIMVKDSSAREILMLHSSNKDVVDLLPKYFSNKFQDALQSIEKLNREIILDDSKPIEEALINMFGEKKRKERIQNGLEILVVLFENNLAESTIPDLLYDREISGVKSILGHLPNGSWEALSVFELVSCLYEDLSLEVLQEVDKLLVNGQESQLTDFALSNESFETIEYIVAVAALQKYLIYLESKKNETLNGTNKPANIKIDSRLLKIDPNKKLILKSKKNDSDFAKMNFVLKESYNILSEFIDGSYENYKAIFTSNEVLKERIRWKTEMKELQYFVCFLSGTPFKEKNKTTKKYDATIPNTGENILIDNEEPWANAANCFLNKEGKIIDGGSISTPNAVRPIPENQKIKLDAAIAILKR